MYSIIEQVEDITYSIDQTSSLAEAFAIRDRSIVQFCIATSSPVRIVNDDLRYMGIKVITNTKTVYFWLHKD